jgi:hypothetical protein
MGKGKSYNGTIRVGLGQTKSGKILDRNTHWYHLYKGFMSNIGAISQALQDHDNTGKPVFYSDNGKGYVEIDYNELNSMIENEREYHYGKSDN